MLSECIKKTCHLSSSEVLYFFTLMLGASIGVSIAFSHFCFAIVVVFSLFVVWRQSAWSDFFQACLSPIGLAAVGLWALIALSVLYTPVSSEQAAVQLIKYKNLLIVPVLVYLGRQYPSLYRHGLAAVLLGCLIHLALIYVGNISGIDFNLSDSARPSGVRTDAAALMNSIATGFMMNLLVLGSGLQLLVNRTMDLKERVFYMLLHAMVMFYMVSWSFSRTAILGLMFVYALLFLVIFSRRRFKYLLFFGTIAVWVLFMVMYMNTSIGKRVNVTSDAIESFIVQDNIKTSAGIRLVYYHQSLKMMQAAPIFGFGAGSFPAVYTKFLTPDVPLQWKTDNPHNEFLNIGAQQGLLGLFLLIWFFFVAVFYAGDQPGQRELMFGLTIMTLIACLFNSAMMDFYEGMAFCYIAGICTDQRSEQ